MTLRRLEANCAHGTVLHDMEAAVAAQIWWMIHKDLVSEWRSRRAWPAMILLGIVVAVVFSVQIELPSEYKCQIAASLLWIALFLAATLSLDRSFSLEREDGCWRALLLYPVSATSVYLAKLAANIAWLAVLQCALIPLFAVLTDVPLLRHPWAMGLVALLGNVGIASAGTLLAALAARLEKGASLTAVLALPMLIPVVLAASEATYRQAEGRIDGAWWDWNGLLACFAVVFIVAGIILIDFVAED
jgi:heme exporter protein B